MYIFCVCTLNQCICKEHDEIVWHFEKHMRRSVPLSCMWVSQQLMWPQPLICWLQAWLQIIMMFCSWSLVKCDLPSTQSVLPKPNNNNNNNDNKNMDFFFLFLCLPVQLDQLCAELLRCAQQAFIACMELTLSLPALAGEILTCFLKNEKVISDGCRQKVCNKPLK